ncbi:Uma2 family endonuclease [Streptomyces sp. ODS28]|uniref:Uma2 family endonuclease n=1 Tax=Streptomyces sp. ODS28 TaxID=3136688 RepID=UPI0031E79B15
MTENSIYHQLREFREHMELPPHMTWPEISGAHLVMMMSPRPRHQLTAKAIARELDAQLPEGLWTFEATDIEDSALAELRVPDLLIVPPAAMETDDPLDPREIELAIEIVSPTNPENDYKKKVRVYPAMGIPVYLIVDPRDGTWTLYDVIGTEDGRPAYENRLHRSYGVPVQIGDWKIETADLPRYSDKDMRS